MSGVVAFYIVAILSAVGLVVAWIVWKFRFVIRSGYFRAELLTESGVPIIRTFKLGTRKEFRMMIGGVWGTYHIYDGRTELLPPEKEGDPERKRTYPNRVYHQGRMRIPKSYYNVGQSEPIDMQALRKESQVSAEKYDQLARNTVTTGLLGEFRETSAREAAIQILTVLIPVGAIFITGYYLNTRLETIIDLLGGR